MQKMDKHRLSLAERKFLERFVSPLTPEDEHYYPASIRNLLRCYRHRMALECFPVDERTAPLPDDHTEGDRSAMQYAPRP